MAAEFKIKYDTCSLANTKFVSRVERFTVSLEKFIQALVIKFDNALSHCLHAKKTQKKHLGIFITCIHTLI